MGLILVHNCPPLPGVGFLLRNCLGMVCLEAVSRSSPPEKIEKFFQKIEKNA